MKLTIELVPQSAWYKNVRSKVTPLVWNTIKQEISKRALHRCEICGGRGTKWPVEAHEIFSYQDFLHIQKLEKIQALCPKCHMVKHIGLVSEKGLYSVALRHFMQVNEINKQEAEEYIREQFVAWRRRSKFQWNLNIEWLTVFLARMEKK